MILETWQIKVLQHWLIDYNQWLNNACGKGLNFDREELPIEIRYNIFTERELALQYKIYIRLKKTLEGYELNNEKFDEYLTNEQKVDIIISQEGYKNRIEKNEDAKLEIFQEIKNFAINLCNSYYTNETENQTKIEEINNCKTIQEMSIMHNDLNFKNLKKKLINASNIFILDETEKQNKIDEINACETVQELDVIAKEFKIKYQI